MRLVFVNRFFHPDLSATSQMLSELAFSLAAKGHDVHVVCSRQRYEDAGAKLPNEECVRGVHVHRAWSTKFGRGNLVGRALDYLSFYVGAYQMLKRVVAPGSVLVAKTDPPLISIPAARVARLRRAHLVNWLQDVFPEVAQQFGMGLVRGRFGRLLTWLRDRSLHVASGNVTIGERMREHIARRGVSARRISVIANWSGAVPATLVSDQANELRSSWGLDGKFVVMYSGNMGRAHDFDTMLEAAELLRDQTDIVFVCVGGGARRAHVVTEVKRRSLTNVQFLPYQPADHLAASLSAADVHLITLLPDQEGLVVPSKFYGVLAVGRPSLFVGDPDGEIARVIGAQQIGAAVPLGEARLLADEITRLANAPERCVQLGQRARALFEEKYSHSIAVTEWEALLHRVSISSGQGERSRAKVGSAQGTRSGRGAEPVPSGFSPL